jgi:hypothetical protein
VIQLALGRGRYNKELIMSKVLAQHWKIALLWICSLVLVGVVVARAEQDVRLPPLVSAVPEIISGSDIGFRVDRTVDGIPQGSVVIRVDGKWIAVASNRR